MAVPVAKAAVFWVPEHEGPLQLVMPGGVLVTAPPPLPDEFTVRTLSPAGRVKAAVTVVSESSAIAQFPVPLQTPPLQPAKVMPGSGTAASPTTDPAA